MPGSRISFKLATGLFKPSHLTVVAIGAFWHHAYPELPSILVKIKRESAVRAIGIAPIRRFSSNSKIIECLSLNPAF